MDLSKLSRNQQIALGGGILAIISLFLPWYGFSFAGIGANIQAFDSGFFAWAGVLLAIAGAVVIALKAFDVANAKAGNLEAEQLALILGGLGVIFILLRWITETSLVKFGLFVGLIAAAAVAYGAYGTMKDEGLEMPSADDFKSSDDS
ncbi:MAG: hypothetical protein QNJ77_09890 [Acidimicrobiia bacterium]|nr:hypothetical protein [Acidimicrobiia bacterium]